MAPIGRNISLRAPARLTLVATLATAPLGAHAEETVGDASGALPGLVRVGAAAPLERGLVLTGLFGYGYRGAVVAEGDAHHRTGFDLAASYRPLEWLAIAGRFSGRYDRHTATGDGKDSGWVGDPRLAVRTSFPLTPQLALGTHVGVWMPGQDAPSLEPAATTVDALVLATWSPQRWLAVSAQGGYRFDRSAESAPDAPMLSRSDRMVLGVSDFDAALVGAGVSLVASTRTQVSLDWSWDVLVGSGAPAATGSPMRAGLGVRQRLSDLLVAHVTGEMSLTDVPPLDPMDPLIPVEPRFAAMAGVTVILGRPSAPDRIQVDPDLTVKRPPPPPASGSMVVSVTGADGAALVGAEIELYATDKPGAAAPPSTAVTNAEGRATFDKVPPGRARVTVKHADHQDGDAEAEVQAGQVASLSVALERALPPGQLRGSVRSFDGKPLQAELTIAPLGRKVKTDANGEFTVDLPPGEYDLSIASPGFKSQSSHVRIEQDGVTIKNVDLRR